MSKIAFFVLMPILIVTVSFTFTVLVTVKLITAQLLKKSRYHSSRPQSEYQQLQTDLNQLNADLADICLQLDDVEPHLREMEFLKYAPIKDKRNK